MNEKSYGFHYILGGFFLYKKGSRNDLYRLMLKVKTMKETVLIIKKNHYNDDEVLNAFHSNRYNVEPLVVIDDIPKHIREETIENICKSVNPDILISDFDTTEFVEPIRHYKRKYLVNPILPHRLMPLPHIREYDKENTIGLFGGKERHLQWIYSLSYPKYIIFSFYEAMLLSDVAKTIAAIHPTI